MEKIQLIWGEIPFSSQAAGSGSTTAQGVDCAIVLPPASLPFCHSPGRWVGQLTGAEGHCMRCQLCRCAASCPYGQHTSVTTAGALPASIATFVGSPQAVMSRHYCPFLASGPRPPCLPCCPAGVDVTPTRIRASRADVEEGNPDPQQVRMALLSELLMNYFDTQVYSSYYTIVVSPSFS